MISIDTHGLKIDLESLVKAADATAEWPLNCGYWTDIYYDMSDGFVWAIDTEESRIRVYHDPSIIKVCGTSKRHSPQWIADQIYEELLMEGLC